ncbi:unnamed protein product [Darwinula stevensoni]|uniref:Uncharacterized protein n=1 Tax=Darwinula stevensoni TaxID=69355 RepID=A0A7R9ABN9_9CRUS|nr:unnamed protein product [Darwinula stevensoni]CAG0899244.1 unnamed protein product [Darwinula stevensoni]
MLMKRKLMIPWLGISLFWFIVYPIAAIIIIALVCTYVQEKIVVVSVVGIVVFVLIVGYSLGIYFFLVVYSYFKALRQLSTNARNWLLFSANW